MVVSMDKQITVFNATCRGSHNFQCVDVSLNEIRVATIAQGGLAQPRMRQMILFCCKWGEIRNLEGDMTQEQSLSVRVAKHGTEIIDPSPDKS
jgi:hypothetical protein